MPELIGPTLDRYRVVERLAEDSWGSVYKAYDPKFDRTVAIQVLDPRQAANEQFGEHFTQLARTILSWRQAGIARVFNFGRRDSLIYIIREFIPGANLRQILKDMRKRGQWINLEESVQLVRRICLALDYAHQRGVIHGDLHPRNIFITPEETDGLPYQPVLVNLGLARPGHPPNPASNPAYQSPETARGVRFDVRADVYSTGALLYELATGQPPDKAESKYVTLDTGSSLPFLPPSIVRPDLPQDLSKVILKALAQAEEDRYQNITILAQALTEALPNASRVTKAPPGLQKAVSLLPAYQRSLAQPIYAEIQSDSIVPENLEPNQDKIHIQIPGQVERSVVIGSEGLDFGRSVSNDVVLDHPSISRHHARIEFDGTNYLVRDLKSMNGAYLGETRLAPNSPQLWSAGEELRLGEVRLRLERAEQSYSTIAATPEETRPLTGSSALPATEAIFLHPDGSPLDSNRVSVSENPGWVAAYTEQTNLSLSPGDSVTASILLFNHGPAADIYKISMVGAPQEWIPNPPQTVNLPAGSQREISLTFKPPRSPYSRAGRHQVTLHIDSQNASRALGVEQSVDLRFTLTVTAFSQFSSELRPAQINSGETGQVLVYNQGNLPETFTITWEDHTQEIVFDPPQVKVAIPEGKSAAVEFQTSLLQPRWFGGEFAFPYQAHVSSQSGQLQSHAGEYISRALIPVWAPVALASMCVMLICVAFLYVNQLTAPSRYAQQTAQAGGTAVAIASQETVSASTATAAAIHNANQATLSAITATAQWLAADEDQDGLNNSLEIQAGTRPDVADTDEDGLNDGDEVNVWKTNPVIADTDGDGLKDGQEIEEGIDPLKKDTDGDGIEDAADPDPAHAPTQTVIPTRTLTPSPTLPGTTRTSTPTITLTPQFTTVDLSISVNNNQAVSIPGAKITYSIVVTNKGPAQVTNAQVVDMFPGSLSNIAWTCSASVGGSCQTPNGIANINTTVNLPAGGSATINASGDLSPSAVGLLINTATVTAPTGLSEPNTVDNLAIDTDTLAPKISLTISKTDGKNNIAPGQATNYTIVVTNDGPSAAAGIGILDNFPSALGDINWTCSATSGSSCATNSQMYGNINTSVNLYPGGKATFTVNANVKNDAAGTIANTAYIESPIDPVNNNKSATDNTTISAQVDLAASVDAPLTAAISTPITYTIAITNTGPSLAHNVVLTDLLPEDVVFLNVTPWAPTCVPSASTVTCNLGNLAPGTKIQVKISIVTPPTPGPINNQVSVLADENDPTPANNLITTGVLIE
jgi:uncharacterized repeat protein (TIGR01451 family)